MTQRIEYVSRIGRFENGNQIIFFEGRRFNSLVFANSDPSVNFMNWLADRSLTELAPNEVDDPSVAEMLRNYGFILDRLDSNILEIADRYHRTEAGALALSVHLIVAQYCNLACSYCYNGTETYETRNKAKMSPQIAEAALRQVFRTATASTTSLAVNFLGGEPLLNWPVIKYVLENMETWAAEESYAGRIHSSLQTNLTFLPKGLVEVARNKNLEIFVEIDGPKALHDEVRGHKARGVSSFDATERNCKTLRNNGLTFHAKSVLTTHNIEEMETVRATHFELGAASSTFSDLRPVDSDHRTFDAALLPREEQMWEASKGGSYLEQTKSKAAANILRSIAGKTIGCHQKHAAIFSVTASGQVYNCPWFVRNDAHFVGHVTEKNST